jgi:uncharacterized alkaline shock family protein YloU
LKLFFNNFEIFFTKILSKLRINPCHEVYDQVKINDEQKEVKMTNETTPLGSIHVSPQAIATIAYQSALESYGVVGMAARNVVNGLANVIAKDPTHGVSVQYDGEHINIDLYVIVEYGTRIKSVANSVANTVRYHVEKTMGLPIHEINVHVQGLRISNLD